MVLFLSLSKKVNQIAGPFLLRAGIDVRARLQGGIIRDNPTLDNFALLPLSQKLVSLEVREALVGQDSNKDERVQIFESYVRKALLPTETWGDVRYRWQFHSRLLKWIRKEYLWAEHGHMVKAALARYSTLRNSLQFPGGTTDRNSNNQSTTITKMSATPNDVVKMSLLRDVQGETEEEWVNKKDRSASIQPMRRIAQTLGGRIISLRGGAIYVADVNDQTSLEHLPLSDVIELAGGHVQLCSPFNSLCEEANIYQLWTKEYIELLGGYLLDRSNPNTVILDVGSGDGILSLYLRQYFEQRKGNKPSPIPKVVAIDDGSWKLSTRGPVENLDVNQGMEKYATKDTIVICSWMPMGIDWSEPFRRANVMEYILIGEADDGQCGDNFSTWGNKEYVDDTDERLETERDHEALFRKDGYRRKDLDFLAPYQWSRFDCRASKFGCSVSFRREL